VLAHHGPRIESLDANDTEVPGWPECSVHAAAGGTRQYCSDVHRQRQWEWRD